MADTERNRKAGRNVRRVAGDDDLASLGPTRRAAKVDPLEAMR